jgi:ParB-like nuclease domain
MPCDLVIEYLGVSQLRPFANNARTHSKKQVRQIADSIKTFGFTNPVLIDDACTILAGHGRVAAAKLLGMKQVPCVRLSEMTSSQKRAYVLADNKFALNAGWDEDMLAVELQELAKLGCEINIELTGFSALEIDSLIEIGPAHDDADPAEDKLPPLGGQRPVTQQGDLWLLDRHKVYCGDSRHAKSFQAVLGGERAQMVFTDPPYNVRIDGNVSGLGKVRHREFAMASGEMSPAEFEHEAGVYLAGRLQRRRVDTFHLHGLAPPWRDTGCRRRNVFGVEEHLRVGQGQRRDGHLLPLAS